MNSSRLSGSLIAILPCNDVAASECFYNRLGFFRVEGQTSASGESNGYRMPANDKGGHLHLTGVTQGWLIPGRNPFGLYLYLEDVDSLAHEFQQRPEDKPWGMYEFGISDPDETLIRVGWPSHHRKLL